jgi:periplasmic divalent cation tolerance protein
MSSAKPVVVLSTCNDPQQARAIARELVENQIAACVTVRDGCDSFFRWKGKIENEQESLLIIKTMTSRVKDVENVVRQLSGYEVPEVLALNIVDGSADYLKWLKDEVKE